jgi:putative transposase
MNVKSNLGAAKGWHSRGYLPHFDSPEVVQHILLRTADSLPAATIAALPRDARLRRQRIDESLDLGYGAALLREVRVASIVEAALLYFDGQRYRLIV